MDITYRSYKKENYSHCEDLVNVAWGFDKIFKSESLRTIAKYLYTKGSLVSSNYRYVAVYEGVIVGFIFGFNSSRNKHRLAAVWLGLKATIDLSFKKMDKEEKNNFIEIIKNHQINRSKVISGKNNEIQVKTTKLCCLWCLQNFSVGGLVPSYGKDLGITAHALPAQVFRWKQIKPVQARFTKGWALIIVRIFIPLYTT